MRAGMRGQIADVPRAGHTVVALRVGGAAAWQADVGAAVLSETDVDRADVPVSAVAVVLATGGMRQVLTDAALDDAVVVGAGILIVALAGIRAAAGHGRVQARPWLTLQASLVQGVPSSQSLSWVQHPDTSRLRQVWSTRLQMSAVQRTPSSQSLSCPQAVRAERWVAVPASSRPQPVSATSKIKVPGRAAQSASRGVGHRHVFRCRRERREVELPSNTGQRAEHCIRAYDALKVR